MMPRISPFLLLASALFAAALPADAQEPNFGRAIVLSGSELVIGQPVNWYGPGTVYTYVRDGSGEWSERTTLVASDSARMDDFGRTLALDGNTLVVGAPRKRDGSGTVYVFEREGAGEDWRETAALAPSGGDYSEYGAGLLASGADLFVGAPALESSGAVHHYRREGDAWALHGTLRPSGADGDDRFGWAIARADDHLLVGAPGAASGEGRVYVFTAGADGDWEEQAAIDLPVPEDGPSARSGWSIQVADGRAYVGAPGAARVFVLEPDETGAWSVSSELAPGGEADEDSEFGYALAVAGGGLWVGAPGVNSDNGRVYRFAPDPAGGLRLAREMGEEWADGTSWPFMLGFSLASNGEQAVIGMPQRDFGEGRALVVAREGDEWRERQLLEGRIYRIGQDLASGERCEEGLLGGEFTCENMEVIAHLPTSALGGGRGVWVNDVWGWTDPETGRNYALVARRDGMGFVDVTEPSEPRLVGDLPRTEGSPPSTWRDVKVSNDHAYIVSDGAGAHGMQVFDLARLRDVTDAPELFEPDITYHEINSAHNLVANPETGFLFVVGASAGGETCGGGLHMVDARDPKRPTFAGCYHDPSATSRGYTHDAQCVLYRGPDERYEGREICVGSNVQEINIADVTDKSNPVTVGRNSYPNVSYAHQGWFDEEQRYFYMNDEQDEVAGVVDGTRTIVWDLTELDDPVVAHEYIGPVMASDHNLFVTGDLMYQSNYGSGLRVLDISERTAPREIGFLDSAPYNDDGPGYSATESGAWSNYPFFEGDFVIFTSVREGLFIVRVGDSTPIS